MRIHHWLKCIVHFVLNIVLMCALIACERQGLHNEMRKFMSKEVYFPSTMIEITEGRILSGKIKMVRPALVFFHGKEECSSCAIGQIVKNLSEFNRIENVWNCKVVIIFSPDIDDALNVQEQIRKRHIPFPIYLDLYGDFYQDNDDFPSDPRFHSFLLGKDAHPVFIGNPLYDDRLSRLFEYTMKQIR